MTVQIDLTKCNICEKCIQACPQDAISCEGDMIIIDQSLCTLCKRCIDICPLDAIFETEIIELDGIRSLSTTLHDEIIDVQPVQIRKESSLSAFAKLAIPKLLDGLIYFIERKLDRDESNQITRGQNYGRSEKGVVHRNRYRKRGGN